MMPARAASLSLALAVAGCVIAPPAPVAPLYAFVVLGPDGRAVARAIVNSTTCPAIDVDGTAQPMTVRAPAQLLPQRAGQAKPTDFPVAVCEHLLPAGVQRATIGAHTLPLPKSAPSRIVVLGDTGCRLFANKSVQFFQPCNTPALWPFRSVAAVAAGAAPDLVIHVGDYHYRESPCPPENDSCKGSPWGYGFDAWDADFFDPARPLLAAAPWIVVRGNHETCDRAGQGWWRTLDPRPLAPQQDCNAVADDPVGDYSAPYAVPIGDDMRVLVFDSANATNLADPPAELVARYREQLAEAFVPASSVRTFFVVHHPPLAFAANHDHPQDPYPGNAALQRALTPLFGSALFPPPVTAVFSGHIHAFEAVTYSTGQPPQLVFGDGGTAVDEPLPDPFPSGKTPLPGAVVRDLRYTIRFGFATLDRTPAGWTLTAYDITGVPMETCTLMQRQATCTPIAR